MNIAKTLYAAFIGSLALVMLGSLCANDNPTTGKSTRVNIHGHSFEVYPPDTQKQTQILHALYNFLNYDADDYNQGPEPEYYKEYSIALKSIGHHTVLMWWNALHAREENGIIFAELPRDIYSWYTVGDHLKNIEIVLSIAMNKGKGNLTYKELLNTLESLYTENNDYHNRLIQWMITERDHLRSLV